MSTTVAVISGHILATMLQVASSHIQVPCIKFHPPEGSAGQSPELRIIRGEKPTSCARGWTRTHCPSPSFNAHDSEQGCNSAQRWNAHHALGNQVLALLCMSCQCLSVPPAPGGQQPPCCRGHRAAWESEVSCSVRRDKKAGFLPKRATVWDAGPSIGRTRITAVPSSGPSVLESLREVWARRAISTSC